MVGRASLFVVLVVGCSSSSSNPKAIDAAKEFGAAYCAKLQSCYPDAFAASYPNGVSDRLAKITAAIDPNATESCSQSQVDACTHDAQNLACDATLSTATLPSSCSGC